jgi:hypothetical protein
LRAEIKEVAQEVKEVKDVGGCGTPPSRASLTSLKFSLVKDAAIFRAF